VAKRDVEVMIVNTEDKNYSASFSFGRDSEEIKLDIQNHPENVEVEYNIKSRSFLLYDFNHVLEKCEGVVRYTLSKKKLLELLIKYGEFAE
jgi:hypothetical protein